MTLALCLASFAAGYLFHWAASRNGVSKAHSDVLELLHARHSAEAEIALATGLETRSPVQ